MSFGVKEGGGVSACRSRDVRMPERWLIRVVLKKAAAAAVDGQVDEADFEEGDSGGGGGGGGVGGRGVNIRVGEQKRRCGGVGLFGGGGGKQLQLPTVGGNSTKLSRLVKLQQSVAVKSGMLVSR